MDELYDLQRQTISRVLLDKYSELIQTYQLVTQPNISSKLISDKWKNIKG